MTTRGSARASPTSSTPGEGRDYNAAERAARALGEAGRASWSEGRERAAATFLDRAFQLTGPYGPTSGARRAAAEGWSALVEIAANDDETEPADLNALLVVGLKYDAGDAERLASVSEAAAERAEALGRWHLALQIWATTSDWWRRVGDGDRAHTARLRGAQTHEREAEETLARSSDVRHIQATEPLRRAVVAYRKAGEADKAQEVHLRLQEVQRAGMAEHARWDEATRQTVDLTEIADVGTRAVRGLPIDRALVTFATLLPLPSKTDRFAETAENLNRYVFSAMFEPRLVNHDGKLTGRAQTMWARAVQEEAHRMRLFGAGPLGGARRQMWEEHTLTFLPLYATLMHSSWVPPGRERAYTRALLAGYRADWDVMLALLCPQIEHSVRTLLRDRAGLSSSSLSDRDGLQKEYTLSAVLAWPEAERVLGADAVFALQVLLVEPTGPNLRNQMAHGLVGDGQLDAAACEYLFWLALRLALFPPGPESTSGTDSPDDTESDRDSESE